MDNLSIIIPTKNEVDNLENLFKRIGSTNLNPSIIVVDSDSDDGTRDTAKKLANKYNLETRVLNTKQADLSNSVIIGIEKSETNHILVMDADLQHPPEMIRPMVKKLKNADLVIGSRFVKGSKVKFSLYRMIFSKITTFFIRILFPSIYKVKDPFSGFFVFNKKIIKNKKLKPLGFKILLEILIRGDYNEFEEMPFIFGQRKEGQSKLSIKETKLSLLHLIRLKFK